MKSLRRVSILLGWAKFIVLLIAVSTLVYASSSSNLLTHLRYLASDKLKGRGNGSAELDQAARYIAGQFEKYGLKPAGENSTYFQEFELGIGRRLGGMNGIVFRPIDEHFDLHMGRDYVPLTYGSQTTVVGPVVFAGHGITAPELGYDDYQDLDVRDKIVLVFEDEPDGSSRNYVFGGKEVTPYATSLHKILNAKSRGAKAIILSPKENSASGMSEVAAIDPRQVADLGIHAVRIRGEIGDRLLRTAGRDPVEILRWINSHPSPYSFSLDFDASVSIEVLGVRRVVRNVIGFVPGQSDQVIVIGAHYDHLGLGEKTSLAPELIGQIHNGADDNASGTAGLLTLAENYAGTRPRRGLLFIAFAGEELGLLGSRYYTEHPTYPLKRTNAMINLDMIGRSDGDLLIGGVGTSVYFKGILDELQGSSSLHFTYSDSLQGSSDHLSFLAQKIPVLFFFSGLHSDYHRPSDDWERIDLVRTEEILGVVSGMLGRLMMLDGALEYVDITVDQQQKRIAGRRDRPRFGVFPDMSWNLGGVRFNEIVNGAPAQKSGVRAGDILIRFDRQKIENLNRFLRILQTKTPGDEVEVVLLREAKIVQTTVHLDARD